jgi:hypothetical protein
MQQKQPQLLRQMHPVLPLAIVLVIARTEKVR